MEDDLSLKAHISQKHCAQAVDKSIFFLKLYTVQPFVQTLL